MISAILFYALLYYIFSVIILMVIRFYHHISSDEPLIKLPIWLHLLKAPLAPVVVILLVAILMHEDRNRFKRNISDFFDKLDKMTAE